MENEVTISKMADIATTLICCDAVIKEGKVGMQFSVAKFLSNSLYLATGAGVMAIIAFVVIPAVQKKKAAQAV